MQGGTKPQGYTIVEVLIFLAVTSALFVAVAVTFAGRQARTEFSVAARDMESRLQDIVNDVSSGYYLNSGIQCTVNAAGIPTISGGAVAQGSNAACIFIGRVAQFDVSGAAGKQYNVYSVAGARQKTIGSSTQEVEGFNDAHPRAIATPDQQQIPRGLTVDSMYYIDGGGARRQIQAVGFFSSFGSYGTQGLDPGSISVNVLPITAAGNTQAAIVSAVAGITDASVMNPPGGVVICMAGDGSGQYAELKIGGNNRQLTTDLRIRNTTCS